MSNITIELAEVVISEETLAVFQETNEQYIFIETIITPKTEGYDKAYVVIVKEGRMKYINEPMVKRSDLERAYINKKETEYGAKSLLMVGVYSALANLDTSYLYEETL